MKSGKWRRVCSVALVAVFGLPLAAVAQHDQGGIGKISANELKAVMAGKTRIVVLDVRGSDFDKSDRKIKGAVRIEPSELSRRVNELPKDAMVVTYCACATDGGAVTAAETLLKHGFKVRVLAGGWNAWLNAGGATEAKPVTE